MTRCLIYLVAFCAFAFRTYGQENPVAPEKKNYWTSWDENYRWRDYRMLICQEEYYADSVERHPEIAPYYLRLDKYKMRGKYLGKIRPLPKDVLGSMNAVYLVRGGKQNFFDTLVSHEVLFQFDEREAWLPIQTQIEQAFLEEVQEGKAAVLYCLFLNEHIPPKNIFGRREGLYNTLLISEFYADE